MATPVKFIEVIATRLVLRLTWGSDCQLPYGGGCGIPAGMGPHVATEIHGEYPPDATLPALKEIAPTDWPMVCDHCPATAPHPHSAQRGIHERPRYNTPSGNPEPGSLWYHEEHSPGSPHCHARWTNCDGRHVYCMLPDGSHWDASSRASNCTLPADTTHRCWVLHGDPALPGFHVDKAGDTCAAGAGSIVGHKGWHGFLHGGVLA